MRLWLPIFCAYYFNIKKRDAINNFLVLWILYIRLKKSASVTNLGSYEYDNYLFCIDNTILKLLWISTNQISAVLFCDLYFTFDKYYFIEDLDWLCNQIAN